MLRVSFQALGLQANQVSGAQLCLACQVFGHSQKLGEAQLLGFGQALWPLYQVPAPNTLFPIFKFLEVFRYGPKTWKRQAQFLGAVKRLELIASAYSNLAFCAKCLEMAKHLAGKLTPKTWFSNLQVFGRGPATLPCTPSIWRWPNVLAVTGKVAGSGAGPNMTCGPLFQALAPNAWFPFVAAKLRQVFGHKQKLGKTRSIVGRGQPLGPSCQVLAPKTWVSNLQVFGRKQQLAKCLEMMAKHLGKAG